MSCIIRLKGGLGNQLFQYAFGRAIALERSMPLLLDTSMLSDDNPAVTPRNYALEPFSITASLLEGGQLRRHGIPATRAGIWLARRGISKHDCRYVLERKFEYDPSVLRRAAPTLIFEGYWQSEKYFLGHAEVIRRELRLHESRSLRELSGEVAGDNSVSVHVRRGDYLTNAAAAATHGVCSMEYYRACFDRIESAVRSPKYYLFTDDVDWAEQNRSALPRDLSIVSSEARLTAHEELTLMSRCRHHILANSSFSWWAAWLDPRADNLVFAPQDWFRHGLDTRDLIPARWTRL